MDNFGKYVIGLIMLAVLTNGIAMGADAPAIELGAPFRDNAILQREMKVPIWGWSRPGTKVTVEFGAQRKSAVAEKDNNPTSSDGVAVAKWMLELDPLKASLEPREFKISDSTGAKLSLTNILVGEVWVAAGQSNMNRPVSKMNPKLLPPPARLEIAPIRQCSVVDYAPSLHPIERANGSWNTVIGEQNAISYAFAHKLYGELDVPIGILHCAVGETTIRTWVPRCGFAEGRDEYTQGIYQKVLETDPSTAEHKAAWNKFYQDIEDTIQENKERVKRGEKPLPISTSVPGNLGSTRDSTWMFNGKMNPMIPYAIRGAIWNQGYASQNEGLFYYNNLHSMIRGWRKLWNRPELPVYFHQFYTAGNGDVLPSIGATAEMRLGTWLARDIPHANMASQIDIGGSIHYGNKTVPAWRFASLALKNEYPSTKLSAGPFGGLTSTQLSAGRAGGKAADLVVDGPMFKSYTVKGNKLIVEFEYAKGGLLVATSKPSREPPKPFATAAIIEKGDDQVKLFYLAGEDRVWHPASMQIDGERVIVTAPGVKAPRGVSYATGGVAWMPNLYNRALLPTTPFILYDHKLVTSENWPSGAKLKIAGVEPNPNRYGKKREYRKIPLLSTQFRDNGVFQADVPITIWGATVKQYGPKETGKSVITFSFAPQSGQGQAVSTGSRQAVSAGSRQAVSAGSRQAVSAGSRQAVSAGSRQAAIEKTIPVTPGMKEWQVTVPPMKASSTPWTLKVSITVDGELVHKRVAKNIVYGDVWYVAAPKTPFAIPDVKPSGQIVRVLANNCKRSSSGNPYRFSVATSTSPPAKNRFAAHWKEGTGLPGALGHAIAAKTERPVGIIFMQSKETPEIKSWISPDYLDQAPSMMGDYKQLASIRPGNKYYDENAHRYVADWKTYWSEYIPEMIATGKIPDGAPWGTGYPSFKADVSTSAAQTWNVSTLCFTPCSFKGLIFLSYQELFEEGKGANFGAEMSALANCWKKHFGGPDQQFFYTTPGKELVPEYARPKQIQGESTAVEINAWDDASTLIQQIVRKVY